MVDDSTCLDPIKNGDLVSMVKVIDTENISKNDEKTLRIQLWIFLKNKAYHLIEHFIAVIFIPNEHIVNRYSNSERNENLKKMRSAFD